MSRANRMRAVPQKSKERHYPVSPAKTIDFNRAQKRNDRRIELIPKSRNQERLILALTDPSMHIAVVHGPAGTGKTYMAMLAAIRELKQGSVSRLVLTRPAVGVDDEQHGFLPGDLNAKMEPWTRPLFDVLREYYTQRDILEMLDEQIVEISPLAFMRGRTFKNSIVIADEMQNATPNQMKMLLTRIGEGSRIWVTGDVEQTDRRTVDNGLLDLVAKLGSQEYSGMTAVAMTSQDIQRHPVIESVLDMYQLG